METEKYKEIGAMMYDLIKTIDKEYNLMFFSTTYKGFCSLCADPEKRKIYKALQDLSKVYSEVMQNEL